MLFCFSTKLPARPNHGKDEPGKTGRYQHCALIRVCWVLLQELLTAICITGSGPPPERGSRVSVARVSVAPNSKLPVSRRDGVQKQTWASKGEEQEGTLSPSGFENLKFFLLAFYQKKIFFSFEWVKWNFTIFGPLWKNLFGYPWENPQFPPWKKSFLRSWQQRYRELQEAVVEKLWYKLHVCCDVTTTC